MKVVVNACYGGFGLSKKACARMVELGAIVQVEGEPKMEGAIFSRYNNGHSQELYPEHDLKRHNPLLVQVVEEMGADASGSFGDLRVVEIPDDVPYEINEYDGNEWVTLDFYKMVRDAKVTLMSNSQVPEINILLEALKHMEQD